MTLAFGSFEGICETAALVVCPLVGTDHGIEPACYSRNVDVAGTLIFQPCEFQTRLCFGPILMIQPPIATCFVHIVAIIMTAIMIYHVRSKYTAVGVYHAAWLASRGDAHTSFSGRKEIVTFFWLYAVIEVLAFILDSGLLPTANSAYPVSQAPSIRFILL